MSNTWGGGGGGGGGGGRLLNTKCVFSFPLQLMSETFLVLCVIQRDIITTVHRSSCKVPVILVRFERKLGFSRWIFVKKKTRISNFAKIRPVGAQMCDAERETDGQS